MMAKIRGIVAEVQGKSCILLTPGGEFVKLNRSPHPVAVGQEIEIAPTSYPWYKTAILAASVILLAVIIPLYPMLTVNAQPVAYVSLDINPSLELGVNKAGFVVRTKSFNQDGKKLLQDTSVYKADVYQAVQALIAQAIKGGYVAEGKENLIVAAFSGDFKIDSQKLQTIIRQEAEEAKVPLQYLVAPASTKIHKEAEANRISQGKYLVFEAAASDGKNIGLEDLKRDGIDKALRASGLKVEELEPGVAHYKPEDQSKPEDKGKEDLKPGKQPPQSGQDKGQPAKAKAVDERAATRQEQGNNGGGKSGQKPEAKFHAEQKEK